MKQYLPLRPGRFNLTILDQILVSEWEAISPIYTLCKLSWSHKRWLSSAEMVSSVFSGRIAPSGISELSIQAIPSVEQHSGEVGKFIPSGTHPHFHTFPVTEISHTTPQSIRTTLRESQRTCSELDHRGRMARSLGVQAGDLSRSRRVCDGCRTHTRHAA